MAQKKSGIHSILSASSIYNAVQSMLGARHAREEIIPYLNLSKNARLLDIGCGTAEILEHLPDDVEYVGFDASEQYINAAKQKYGTRGTFVAEVLSDTQLNEYENFDIVTAVGLMHHLDDNEVLSLLRVAQKALKTSQGTLVTVDPCYTQNQSSISRFVVGQDRGQNVRAIDEYKKLAMSVFQDVVLHHRNDLLNIPYDHALLVCRQATKEPV